MIRSEEVRAKLRELPFRPFRVVTSSGLIFEIQRSDAVMVLNQRLITGEYLPSHPEIAERACEVSLLDVSELHPIPVDPYLN